MNRHEQFLATTLPAGFYWFNEPANYRLDHGLEIFTDDKTDFWQNTHYGFRYDNGHCCLVKTQGDFSFRTRVSFQYEALYDQCGLMVRADAENWIKVSVEQEEGQNNRLGSVVTNLGYSDWATQDIPSSQQEMWYQVRRRGSDFLIESSFDGRTWRQMRIAHLHQIPDELKIGLYACSPISGGFRCHFRFVDMAENDWYYEANPSEIDIK